MQLTQRKRRFRRLIYFLVGLLLGYLCLCWVLSSNYLSPARADSGIMPPYEREVMIGTKGGMNPTWVSKKLDSAKVIFVLGFGNGGVRGSFTELTADLDKAGIACVVPCMPGQDASPERRIGFGDAEAQVLTDTVAWVRSQRKDHPRVILLGVSMGGAASWLSVDKGVQADGIVTESGYAELGPTVNQFFNRTMPLGAIVFRPVVWFAEARSGIRVGNVKPVLSAAHWSGKPALIIQAGVDDLVSPSQGEALRDATGGEYWLVAGAHHAGCYEHDPKAYVDRLVKFADSVP